MLECQPLFDSSDMTITEWVQIAQTIEVEGGECGQGRVWNWKGHGRGYGVWVGPESRVGLEVGMDIKWMLGEVMVWEGLNVGGTGGQGRPPAEH